MLYPQDVLNQYTKRGCEDAISLNKIRDAWSKAKINGHHLDNLEVKISPPKGLGVFARKKIQEGSIVEICHCIVAEIPMENYADRGLIQYAYSFSDEQGNTKKLVLPLGFGCIYNSSETSEDANLIHIGFPQEKIYCFLARKDIEAGEECCTFHGTGYFNTWCKINHEESEKEKANFSGKQLLIK